MKFILTVSVLLATSVIWSQEEYVDHSIDVLHYDVTLELNDSTDEIRGYELITFDFVNYCDSFFIDFQSIHDGKGMQLESPILLDAETIDYKHVDDRIWFYPDETWKPGSHEFKFYYSGVPETGLIIGKNKFEDRTFFGDNWPNRAHHWFACLDHPSDKATINFSVKVPIQYQCVATGDFISRTRIENGKNWLYSFESSIVLPTKVMVIGVAEFVVDLYESQFDFDITAWSYPQNAKEGKSDMAVSVDVLEYFIEILGDYPFEKLANVQSTTQFGGMENAGNIFYDENAITGDGSMEALIAHEIAHQWFGNSASEKDWPHLWLSEGFATYLTDMYWEHKYGTEAMNERLRGERIRVLKFAQNYTHPVVDTEYAELMHLLNPNSYQKGAWILHMMRIKVGDDAFLEGIKTYHHKFRLSNADTEDFQAIMEEVSDKNLDAFFKQWLYTSGHPILLIESDIKKKTAEISITQTQEGTSFQFDLEIEVIYNNGESEIISIPVTDKKTTHTFEAASKITGYRFDPHVKLLFEEVEY
ncbi:MAG: M1 family metallopeptidase [Crocinitomicaceae bacterium]